MKVINKIFSQYLKCIISKILESSNVVSLTFHSANCGMYDFNLTTLHDSLPFPNHY